MQMNKRHGAEAQAGIGGGTVNPESERNLRIGEDLARKRRPNEAARYIAKALELDPNNFDASIQMAFFAPKGYIEGIEYIKDAEKRCKRLLQRTLGPDCFSDSSPHAGNFWADLRTRPYMRLLSALLRFNMEIQHYEDCADVFVEMMRLCPGDNMGQRMYVGSGLLHAAEKPKVKGKPKYTAADALYFARVWLDNDIDEQMHPPRGGTLFATPGFDARAEVEKHKEPMPAARAEQFHDWSNAEAMYTAALASFKLWGDIPLARQYLTLAAKTNKTILSKILGRYPKPDGLNSNPREANGPESAQDYLWYTYELWMDPNVWAWADSVSEGREAVLKICRRHACSNREKRPMEFRKCSACKDAFYCSAACQKADWKTHKSGCQEKVEQHDYVKAYHRDKMPTNNAFATAASMDMVNGVPTATFLHNV